MTSYSPYKAISDGTRRQILDLLRIEDLTAGVIADQFRSNKLSRTAISKHLRILRQSGLVLVTKIGRERIYTINARPLHEVDMWLKQYEKYWDRQLLAFKEYVESDAGKEKDDG